jgi:hypothetical protein
MKHKRSIKKPGRLKRGLARLPLPGRSKLRKRLPEIAPKLTDSVKKHLPVGLPGPGPLETLSDLPKITNETVAEHREAVLSSARKYIYPLQHSRGAIIKVSITLFIALIMAFFVYCGLALYKLQSTSTFVYEVTRVIPFPAAKAGSHFVSYESYLFELRHLKHYYETQQKENFDDPQWKEHLTRLKQDSMNKVVNDAYVKELASKNNISVSNREVEDQIALVKSQNRLGTSDQMLHDVLDQFWGWSIDDFKRELKTQLLSQKVASELDTATHARAANAYAEIQGGADFAAVVVKYSDDAASKDKGGAYGGPIGKTDRDVPPHVVNELYKLSPGQVSGVVDTGYTLEILKNLGINGEKINAAHISFKLQPITTYTGPLKAQTKIHRFIHV